MSRFQSDIQQAPFLYLNDHPKQYYENINDVMQQGYIELEKYDIEPSTILRDTFMSARNIDLIQRWLIREVVKKTNILIPYQKIEHITQIMNAVFNTHCQNLPFGLKQQIFELDIKTITIIVPTIISELQSKILHIKAIDSINFIEQPIYMGAKGQRSLPSTTTT